MSNSKGQSFWGVYAHEHDDGTYTIDGYPDFHITESQWGAWHDEFDVTLGDDKYVSSFWDQLCEFMVIRAITGDTEPDPFEDTMMEGL